MPKETETKTIRTGIVETLKNFDISKQTRKKNGNTYLPWANCWEDVKSIYPDSYFVIHKQQITFTESDKTYIVERPWFVADGTGWVEVEVFVVDKDESGEIVEMQSHCETYPILDLKNKSVPFDDITTAEVNKSLKRALVKAVAEATLLGINLFYGEDLPTGSREVEELIANISEIVAKKVAISDAAKKKVKELCVKAEREANPDLEDDLITGNYKNIDDADVLTKLQANLMAIRK